MDKSIDSRPALDKVVVLDHTTALAGPYCTQLLGDMGAEVIKIEPPGTGDPARTWGPPFVGNQSAYFLGANRNKRSMTLDLGRPAGREILGRLIARADVLVHNVPREASRKKLGLDEKSCRSGNPRLIWASITGFGNSGPYAGKSGYDVIAQGMSGTMYITGEKGSGPMRFPTPISDITTGLYTALAVVTALFVRERTGIGQAIDNALFDSQVTWLSNLASNHLASGRTIEKLGNAHPNLVPYQPFPTADGWIIVGVGSESLWKRLVVLVECPELAEDPRFVDNARRLLHRDILIPVLAEAFRRRTSLEWLEGLDAEHIPAGPIQPPEQALKDGHLLARGMVVELDHPALGKARVLGNPIKMSETPVRYLRPAPLLGEHTAEILAELGYESGDISDLRNSGVV